MVAGPPTLIPKYIKEALNVQVEYNIKKALRMVRRSKCVTYSVRKAEPGSVFIIEGI